MTKSEKPTIFRAERETLKVTFLVFSGSSIMCVASAVDPLRAANRISGETLFDFKLVSLTGEAPVTTSMS
ncbi:MAG: GlxA family transcriptional regulator, partial [Mesorhizobium sp.]